MNKNIQYLSYIARYCQMRQYPYTPYSLDTNRDRILHLIEPTSDKAYFMVESEPRA